MAIAQQTYTQSRIDELASVIAREIPEFGGNVYNFLPSFPPQLTSCFLALTELKAPYQTTDMLEFEWSVDVYFVIGGGTEAGAEDTMRALGDKFVKLFTGNARDDISGARSTKYYVNSPHWYWSEMGPIEFYRVTGPDALVRTGVFTLKLRAQLTP